MQEIINFNSILNSFKIKAECVDYQSYNNYFFYDLKLSPLVRVKNITKISDELSLSLKTPCKPSVKVLHEQGTVRLEFIKPISTTPKLTDLFLSDFDKPEGDLVCLLGKQVDGKNMWMDLSKNPHMIVAGTTGSGKSTLLHNIIGNTLKYSNARIFIVDPKNIEFTKYENVFDNVYVYNDYNTCLNLIKMLLELMETRYNLLRSSSKINLRPQVVIIDEFADLIFQDKSNELYSSLCRLAQKCRAAKIHLILSTQRPSSAIINGEIKANFPARIACKVSSHIDSKIILDSTGAENLLGKGDALLKDNFRNLERFQIAQITTSEIVNSFSNLI